MLSILYRSEDFSVFLLDTPASIEEAQRWHESSDRRLLSTKPIERAFKTPEPRSERARKDVVGADDQAELHEDYVNLIELAIQQIHGHHTGDWCSSRHVAPDTASRKRRASDDGSCVPANNGKQLSLLVAPDQGVPPLPDQFLRAISGYEQAPFAMMDTRRPKIVYTPVEPKFGNDPVEVIEAQDDAMASTGLVVNNQGNSAVCATISAGDSHRFLIPPASMAVLASCDDSANLRNALRSSSAQDDVIPSWDRRFALILLDPPWPNRSAKRRGSYETQYGLRDTKGLLYGMDLDMCLSLGGYVAIWITNKSAVRKLVLGDGTSDDDGWFGSLDVDLVEEWIWIKTTVYGEPISALDGLWRKPFEVLLIGKQRSALASHDPPAQVRRRVIAAVPDLHSRKPCLKSLFDRVLFREDRVRVLEIFARYMVSGWWSWGDEVIKFNWEGSWS